MTKTVEELEADVKAAAAALAEAEAEAALAHKEFPKYVPVHESHVVRKQGIGEIPEVVAVPAFPEHHVDRDGTVKVLVVDAEHEAKATSEATKAHEKQPEEM
jgi:multidrug resistance efflux pump